MNEAPFVFEGLRRFDSYIGRTNNSRVALPVENASAHGTRVTIISLSHVSVIFLPPTLSRKGNLEREGYLE